MKIKKRFCIAAVAAAVFVSGFVLILQVSRYGSAARQEELKKTLSHIGLVGEVDENDRLIGVSIPLGYPIETMPSPTTPHLSVEDCSVFESMSDLEVAFLNRTGISDEGLKSFKELHRLRILSLRGSRITDQGIEYLRNLSRLEFLDLSSTIITNDGLASIRHLKAIRGINIGQTAVTDAGLSQLISFPKLQRVGLSPEQVTKISVAYLKDLPKLQDVYVYNLYSMSDDSEKRIESLLIPKFQLYDPQYGDGFVRFPMWAEVSPPSFWPRDPEIDYVP